MFDSETIVILSFRISIFVEFIIFSKFSEFDFSIHIDYII